jgi:rhamnogalacturonan endolyase
MDEKQFLIMITFAKTMKSFLVLQLKLLLALFLLVAGSHVFAQRGNAVTLKEDAETFTLDNGVVTAKVAKASGDLVSLRYKGLEMLATFLTPEGEPDLVKDPPGANPNGLNRGMTDHQYGFWSHDAMGPRGTAPAITKVTIDPARNGGARAEVSVKGIAEGRKMGTGPGASPEGQFAADVEIRYALGRGESGVYTYCIFEHKPGYPYTQLGEARFCAKLADFFDWLSVDENRNMHYPKDMPIGDKYQFTANLHRNQAFGWSSTTKNVGLFFINPTMEYMSGGPTKVEFMGHRDTNPVGAPCVLNYWRSSHYGGAEVNVAEGEHWTKVVGPFLIYVNSGKSPQDIYADARARVAGESAKWPFEWVSGVDYPLAAQRATVKGKLVLNDPYVTKFSGKLTVGLTAPAYDSPRPSAPAAGAAPVAGAARPAAAPVGAAAFVVAKVDWQKDAKYYQFWASGKSDGSFGIEKVRPGRYTLHAFADGVPGEFVAEGIVVEAGKPLNLGSLTWKPVRYGKLLWEVGIPNRLASEFFLHEDHNEVDISLRYAKLFPNDVNFVIGKSDSRKDWFFQHVPHSVDTAAAPPSFFGPAPQGRATPYTITFQLTSAPKGTATLRVAICGTGPRSVDVAVNGAPAGQLANLMGDGTISRHGSHGIWYEKLVTFDASMMKSGENTLTLTVPAGAVTNGMLYDYLSLELAE